MGEVTINYTNLNMAGQFAGKARSMLEEYGSDLNTRILPGLESLPGGDPAGYISTAVSLASEKCCNISKARNYFEELKPRIDKLSVHAREADERVKKKIESIAEYNLGRVDFLTAISNKIYDIFCIDMADALAVSPLLDAFIDRSRDLHNMASDWLETKVLDWFRYGDGKYWANEILSGLKVIGAVAATITAATCSSVILATVGVVAGIIYIGYAYENYRKTKEAQEIARDQSENGNKGLAHYYGGISGVSDWTKKNDYGNAEDNIQAQMEAEIFDTIGESAKLVLDVVNIFVSIDKLGEVYGMDGKTVVDHDYSKANMLRNLQRKIYQARIDGGISYGYDEAGNVKTGYNLAKLFFGTQDLSSTPKKMSFVVKLAENGTNYLTDTHKDIDTISEYMNNPQWDKFAETIDSTLNILSHGALSEAIDIYVKPVSDIISAIDKCVDIRTGKV